MLRGHLVMMVMLLSYKFNATCMSFYSLKYLWFSLLLCYCMNLAMHLYLYILWPFNCLWVGGVRKEKGVDKLGWYSCLFYFGVSPMFAHFCMFSLQWLWWAIWEWRQPWWLGNHRQVDSTNNHSNCLPWWSRVISFITYLLKHKE